MWTWLRSCCTLWNECPQVDTVIEVSLEGRNSSHTPYAVPPRGSLCSKIIKEGWFQCPPVLKSMLHPHEA